MSEDCPSCERYLHDHAEVFAELAALREKLKEYDTAWLDARKEIPGRESADLSPFVMLHAIRELAALWGGARDGRARLREKCERLEKIAGKPGDDRKHWKGQAEEQIRRKRVHEKYKDEFKTRAEAAEQRAERFRCALTEVQALTEHGPCGEGADEDPGDNVIRVRINDIIRDALEPTDG